MDQMADSFQVSPQQEQLWASEPDGPSARTQALAVLRGRVDAAALEAGLRGVTERHESLRTTFVRQPGLRIPLQVVNEALAPRFRVIDLRDLGPDARAARRSAALLEELERPFDLAGGPLVTALLLRVAEDRHELALTVSSLCADPTSLRLLLGELLVLHGGSGELVEGPLQYADFSAWQHELLDSEEDEARSAADFWASMQQVDVPELPFATRATSPGCPEEIEIEIDESLREAVHSAAASYGVSGSAFVQAAWHALLGRYGGADAVTVAYLTPERRHADLEGAIGAFSRPVPLRTAVGDAVTFAEVLQAVERARDDALAWQDYAPVERPDRFPVGFVASEPYRWQSDELAATLERLTLTAPFRLWLTCIADEQDVFVQLSFDPQSHRREIAQRLARGLSVLLRQVSANTSARLADLDLLDETERSLLLEEFNQTAADIPETVLHDLIASVAESAPERDAVRDERGSISYRELDARANQLAQRLIRCGAGPDVGVALCTDRSVDMVVGLLGILKAGSAYVPLHYEHPRARLAHQLETAAVKAIVTQEPLLERLPEFSGEIVCLDRDRAQLDAEPATHPDAGATPDSLAYVIFTSGSTGTPKGVEVTHRNVVNYASDIARRLGADAEPLSFGVVTSISTDLGNTSIFGALCSGGTIVLIPPAAATDAAAHGAAAEREPGGRRQDHPLPPRRAARLQRRRSAAAAMRSSSAASARRGTCWRRSSRCQRAGFSITTARRRRPSAPARFPRSTAARIRAGERADRPTDREHAHATSSTTRGGRFRSESLGGCSSPAPASLADTSPTPRRPRRGSSTIHSPADGCTTPAIWLGGYRTGRSSSSDASTSKSRSAATASSQARSRPRFEDTTACVRRSWSPAPRPRATCR